MLRRISQSLLLFAVVVVSQADRNLSSEYDHSAFLDANEVYKIYWSVKDSDQSIHLAVQVKTNGWVGFGISKGLSGLMDQSDMVVGWVDSKGQAHLLDTHATGHRLSTTKEQQDYDLVGGTEQNGVTILKFKRKLVTCDKTDRDINTGTIKVIYAYGDNEKVSYHNANRGSRSLNLRSYVKSSAPAANVPYFNIISKDVPVPAVATTYWCQAFKMSNLVNLTGTRHLIEIAPIVEKKDEGMVHHMVLYACKNSFNESHLNTTGPCYHPNMPNSIRECVGWSPIFAWAVGGVNFKFPSHVGLPIGASYSFKYVILETHFDNPTKSKNHIITSGLRLYYDLPRKYESAMLTTGTYNRGFVIPPKQDKWIAKGYCPKSCSSKISDKRFKPLNGNEVRFFASFPHAHTAGTGIWTRLLRNGSEVTEIIKDDNYDFNFQQTHLLRKEIPFRSGDELITYCRYNTMKRKYATVGGPSTKDEMCLNFLMYYPRVNLTTCASREYRVTREFSTKYAKSVKNRTLGRFNETFVDWSGVAWNETMIKQLQNIYNSEDKNTLMEVCIGEGAQLHWFYPVNRPVVKKSFPVPENICVKQISRSWMNTYNLLFSFLATLTVVAVLLAN